MRIIAGKFKGRQLDFVSDEKTRPTADIVREALFCKIQFDLEDSCFLDLFAGSGAVGIEALSRGANHVYFVEKNRKNFEIIKKNLKKLYGEDYENSALKQGQEIHLILSGFVAFLDSVAIKSSFDFVFLDPPYNSDFYEVALQKLKENNLITSESMVICEQNAISEFNGYQILSTKRYGTKFLSYIKLIDS